MWYIISGNTNVWRPHSSIGTALLVVQLEPWHFHLILLLRTFKIYHLIHTLDTPYFVHTLKGKFFKNFTSVAVWVFVSNFIFNFGNGQSHHCPPFYFPWETSWVCPPNPNLVKTTPRLIHQMFRIFIVTFKFVSHFMFDLNFNLNVQQTYNCTKDLQFSTPRFSSAKYGQICLTLTPYRKSSEIPICGQNCILS